MVTIELQGGYSMSRQEEIEKRIAELPQGTLTYKTIAGKKQPYLQRTENGKSISVYIKVGEREKVLAEIEERRSLEAELKLLKAYSERISAILRVNPYLAYHPGIGYQDFEMMITRNMLYVDKTFFIKEWWESDAQINLITRPRRFGKTLTLSMVNCFFSDRYSNRSDLFEKLAIWKHQEYRELQGQHPVIFITFATVKPISFDDAMKDMCLVLQRVYHEHEYILLCENLTDKNRDRFEEYLCGLSDWKEEYCKEAIENLCKILYETYGKKVILLIDEYDTPMVEAYTAGFWDDMARYMRNFFNSSLKSNPYIEKVLLTGITRIAKESLFSDMNNLSVHSMTSEKYATCFGFTEEELFNCLECQDIEEKQMVKEWYDGFTIGSHKDIYNPWSIVNYLAERKFIPYWVNSGGYGLMSKLFLKGDIRLHKELEILVNGGSIHKTFDENTTFMELDHKQDAIWSLLFAAGYLKADNVEYVENTTCDISVTNRETMAAYRKMIRSWFNSRLDYNEAFVEYLINDNLEYMNYYMNEIILSCFSYFDVGGENVSRVAEKFYHGFVLGLLVELRDVYEVRSNRESGIGRYDVMLIPKKEGLPGIILELKVRDPKKEESLDNTAENARNQIIDKQYDQELISRGIDKDNIRYYGFGFEGKKVLIK